jgi:hypothetical protein
MDNKLGLFGGYEYIERAQNNNNTTKFKAGGFNPEMEQNVSKDALGIHEELEGGKNKKYSTSQTRRQDKTNKKKTLKKRK